MIASSVAPATAAGGTGPSGVAAESRRSHLVLSPHPDDAIWSAGGRISWWLGRGDLVRVLTVFDGAADAVLPGAWRHIADAGQRQAENGVALSRLGATGISGSLPDAALRADEGAPRYSNPLRLFGPLHRRDETLIATVASMIERLAGAGQVAVHGPLAAGRHVDHVIVRRAAESVPGLAGQLTYYEDFPYRLAARDHVGLAPRYEPVRLGPWLAASACYRTQIPALLGSRALLLKALRARAHGHGRAAGCRQADRVWVRPGTAGASPSANSQ